MIMAAAATTATAAVAAATVDASPAAVSSWQEQIDRLKEQLEEKNETIFDLEISLATADAETKHRIEQVQAATSLTVRRLEEELRRLRHEANRYHLIMSKNNNSGDNNNNKRKIGAVVETTDNGGIAPSESAAASSSSLAAVPQQHHIGKSAAPVGAGGGGVTTPLRATRNDNDDLSRRRISSHATTTAAISSAQRLLLHLASSSSSSSASYSPLLGQRLWLAQTDVQVAQIIIDEWLWTGASTSSSCGGEDVNEKKTLLPLLYQVLTVSPAACRYLVAGGGCDDDDKKQEKQQQNKSSRSSSSSGCQLRIGGNLIASPYYDHDLLNPLWTPTNSMAMSMSTIVAASEPMDDNSTTTSDDMKADDDLSSSSWPQHRLFIDALWRMAVRWPATIAAWDILCFLVHSYRLPFDVARQTLVLRRLVAAGRSHHHHSRHGRRQRRRQGWDDDHDASCFDDDDDAPMDVAYNNGGGDDEKRESDPSPTTTPTTSASTTAVVAAETKTTKTTWLPAAVRLLTAYVRRVDCWEPLLTKLWATWLAVVIDLVEQAPVLQQQRPAGQPPLLDNNNDDAVVHHYDDDLAQSGVQFLSVLAAQHHFLALETFLMVEIVTDASTGELWHRAPSAVAVLCRRLTSLVTIETTNTEEAYLLPAEPSEMVLELVRFFYYIVIAVQEGRRRQQEETAVVVALWDICQPHAEALAGTTALLLERTQDAHTQHLLQMILDELEEDYNERYAKFIKDDNRQLPT